MKLRAPRPLRHLSTWAAVLTFGLATACGGSRSTDAHGRAEGARTTTAATPVAPPRPAPPAAERPAAIPEAEANAVLASWAEAQNRGDFAAYSALYATRFSGIRRNAERTMAFDRAGWMADRQRMFRRPIVVTTSDVTIRTTASSADIAFTQRWASGTYSDEGPKRIALVRENGALKIAVEEMLAATRLGELDTALAIGTFVALPTADGAVALLAHAHADEAVGAPRLFENDESFVVAREAGASAPASLRALVGREVTVIERARTCAGRIDGVRVARVVIPHFSVVSTWNEESYTSNERALEAWALGSYTYYAATVASECHRPVAISLAPIATVVSFTPREPSTAERADLRRAFERTARFAALEHDYVEYLGESEPDDDHPAVPAQRALWATSNSTVIFEHAGRRVGTVVHNAEGCAGFGGSAWASFELGEGAPSEHRLATALDDYVSVVAVFDVEGDGVLEAIIRRGMGGWGLIRLAPTPARIRTVDVDYLDCGC